MKNKLTILVFLKDRFEFTIRLVNYLSTINYPFNVYFADGSSTDQHEQYFQSLNSVNFTYIYKRYPKDTSLLDYYNKCDQSINDIKTPYVMLVDNDDFPVPEGQTKAIDFLDLNLKFIGCNGQVAGISLHPNPSFPYGKNILFHKHYCPIMDVPVKLDQNLAIDRINSYISNFYAIFYSIFRTKSLAQTFSLIKKLNFSGLGFHERFFSYMQIAQGKIHSIDDITYIRQKGSSQIALAQKDWFHQLFHLNWLEDVKRGINVVSNYISTYEQTNYEVLYNLLYTQFENCMRGKFILNDFYLLKNFSLFKRRIPNILMSKLFLKLPFVAEKLSYKFLLRSRSIPSIGTLIKSIIVKN